VAWIESHQALSTHPKVLDLAGRMTWTLDETLGKLHRFWWWCVDYAPDGDLRRFNDQVLAGSVGLVPDRSEFFVQSMVASCWIDRKPHFRVHDWWDYFGRFLQIKYKHNPAKWKAVQASYQSHNPQPTKNPPKNRSKTQDRPTDRPTKEEDCLSTTGDKSRDPTGDRHTDGDGLTLITGGLQAFFEQKALEATGKAGSG
jgi:hypothetical protein